MLWTPIAPLSLNLSMQRLRITRKLTNPSNGAEINYYEIDIKPFYQQIYPNLGKTRLVGYDGMYPGPTFVVEKGSEAVVRFISHADRNISVHLHGSWSMQIGSIRGSSLLTSARSSAVGRLGGGSDPAWTVQRLLLLKCTEWTNPILSCE
jgi:hypothetical protein